MDHVLDSFFREQAWLRALARSLVRDDAEAEDLVQETWLAALRNPPKSPENPRPWLSVVVRRLAARRRARWETELAEPDAHIGDAELPDEVAAEWESSGLLRAAIDDLPGPERGVVLLRYQESRSLEEIADTLGVSPRTVSERLRSAKERLRIRLGDRFDGDEEAGPPAWLAALAPLVDAEEWVAAVRDAIGRAASGTAALTTSGGVLASGALGKLLGAVIVLLLGAWAVPAWLRQPSTAQLAGPPAAARAGTAGGTLLADPRRQEEGRLEGSAPESRADAAPGPSAEPARRLRVDLLVETPAGEPLLDYRFRAVAPETGASIPGASTPLSLMGDARLEVSCAPELDRIALLLEPGEDAASPVVGQPTFRLELDPRGLGETTPLRVRLDRGELELRDGSTPRARAEAGVGPGGWGSPTVVVRRTLTEWPQPPGATGPWTARAQALFRGGVARFEDLPLGTFEVEYVEGQRRVSGAAVEVRSP